MSAHKIVEAVRPHWMHWIAAGHNDPVVVNAEGQASTAAGPVVAWGALSDDALERYDDLFDNLLWYKFAPKRGQPDERAYWLYQLDRLTEVEYEVLLRMKEANVDPSLRLRYLLAAPTPERRAVIALESVDPVDPLSRLMIEKQVSRGITSQKELPSLGRHLCQTAVAVGSVMGLMSFVAIQVDPRVSSLLALGALFVGKHAYEKTKKWLTKRVTELTVSHARKLGGLDDSPLTDETLLPNLDSPDLSLPPKLRGHSEALDQALEKIPRYDLYLLQHLGPSRLREFLLGDFLIRRRVLLDHPPTWLAEYQAWWNNPAHKKARAILTEGPGLAVALIKGNGEHNKHLILRRGPVPALGQRLATWGSLPAVARPSFARSRRTLG